MCRVLISTVGFQHTFIITAIVKLVRPGSIAGSEITPRVATAVLMHAESWPLVLMTLLACVQIALVALLPLLGLVDDNRCFLPLILSHCLGASTHPVVKTTLT